MASALKALENARQLLLGDASTPVFDRKRHIGRFPPASDLHGASGTRKTNGVGQQIAQHLLDARGVGSQAVGIAGDGDVECQLGARGGVLDAGDGLIDDVLRLHRHQFQLDCAGIDVGQIEDAIDNGEQRLGR